MTSVGKPHAAELVGHPFGRPVHVVPAVRIGADAGNPQELAQFVLEPGGMGFQVLVDGGHGNFPGVDWMNGRRNVGQRLVAVHRADRVLATSEHVHLADNIMGREPFRPSAPAFAGRSGDSSCPTKPPPPLPNRWKTVAARRRDDRAEDQAAAALPRDSLERRRPQLRVRHSDAA